MIKNKLKKFQENNLIDINNSKSDNKNIKIEKIFSYIFLISSFLFILLILLLNYFYNSSFIINERTYDIIRKAETLNYDFYTDNLIEKNITDKSPFILYPFLRLFGNEKYEKIIFILLLMFTASTLIFLYLSFNNLFFFFILTFSPFFIRTFTSLSDLTVLFFLFSAVIYFYIEKKYIFSVLISLIISVIDPFLGAFISITMVAFVFNDKDRKNKIFIFSLACIQLIYAILFYIFLKIPQNEIVSIKKNIIELTIVEFGSIDGISIISLILGILGIYFFWKKDLKIMFFLFMSILLVFFSYSSGIMAINIFVIYFASKAIHNILNEKWKINFLKTITLLLIFCSIIFTGIFTAKMLLQNRTDRAFDDSIQWLKSNVPENSIILTHYKYGYKIKFFSRKPVLLDADLSMIKNGNQKFNDVYFLFNTRNIGKAEEILKKYNIKYIFITKEMYSGLVWYKDEQGLLFLLENNPKFSKVYRDNNVRIYFYG